MSFSSRDTLATASYRKGACLCGKVQFTVPEQSEGVGLCHCDDCSTNAGGPFQISAKFDKAVVTINKGEAHIGNYKVMNTPSGMGKHKVFSTCCGCTLWSIPLFLGGEKYIVRTSLLEGGLHDFKPQAEFFTERRPEWLSAIPGAKQFVGYPL